MKVGKMLRPKRSEEGIEHVGNGGGGYCRKLRNKTDKTKNASREQLYCCTIAKKVII